jgi:hypothetical protein
MAGAEWEALEPPLEVGLETLVYEDRAVVPGKDYEYGLALDSGRPQAVIAVHVPLAITRPAIAFESNPFEKVCRIRLTSNGGPASVELFDSSGRRYWAGELESHGAGTRLFTIPMPDEAPPGLYLARMRQGDVFVAARAFRLR